jgi:hypothetical protein
MMDGESINFRLKKIIEKVSEKHKLTDAQRNSIIALIDTIREGGEITDDYLLRVFDQVGDEV